MRAEVWPEAAASDQPDQQSAAHPSRSWCSLAQSSSLSWKPALAWTSRHPREGRRHFRVVLQGGRGSERWVELVSVLTPAVRLRQSFRDLQDRSQWQSGWQSIPPDAEESSDVMPEPMTHMGDPHHPAGADAKQE